MKYTNLIIDLDGTTIPNTFEGLPSKRVVAAVKKARERGVTVSVATGRPLSMARHILTILGIDAPCVVDGGAFLIDWPSEDILYERKISKRVAQQIVDICKEYPYEVYFDGDEPHRMHLPVVDEEVNKVCVIAAEPKDALIIASRLEHIPEITAAVVTAWEEGRNDVHINHVDGTKRHAIEELFALRGVKKENVMAVGDSNNDLPLMEAAGFKVAMGNATDELKAVADFVAPTVDEDGLAYVIERFILQEIS